MEHHQVILVGEASCHIAMAVVDFRQIARASVVVAHQRLWVLRSWLGRVLCEMHPSETHAAVGLPEVA